MILQLGPFILQATARIDKLGFVSRKHRAEIDRLLRQGHYLDAVRYCRRHIQDEFIPARAYVQNRQNKLALDNQAEIVYDECVAEKSDN